MTHYVSEDWPVQYIVLIRCQHGVLEVRYLETPTVSGTYPVETGTRRNKPREVSHRVLITLVRHMGCQWHPSSHYSWWHFITESKLYDSSRFLFGKVGLSVWSSILPHPNDLVYDLDYLLACRVVPVHRVPRISLQTQGLQVPDIMCLIPRWTDVTFCPWSSRTPPDGCIDLKDQ